MHIPPYLGLHVCTFTAPFQILTRIKGLELNHIRISFLDISKRHSMLDKNIQVDTTCFYILQETGRFYFVCSVCSI